jgi:hypothetical protein
MLGVPVVACYPLMILTSLLSLTALPLLTTVLCAILPAITSDRGVPNVVSIPDVAGILLLAVPFVYTNGHRTTGL